MESQMEPFFHPKFFAISLAWILYTSLAFSQQIVCDSHLNAVYLVGPHPRFMGFSGFYFSGDYGQTIELRDSVDDLNIDNFGSLLADAADQTLYRFCYGPPDSNFISMDGGFNWNYVNSTWANRYASGVIPGEIYRRSGSFNLERSTDYGQHYTPCTCNGGPDSLGIGSIALGSDSGEVYVLGDHGKLYYSQDYAENFTYLADLNHLYGIHPNSLLLNGQIPGEVFAFFYSGVIHRIYNYGATEELLADYEPLYYLWSCSATTTHIPGELYFMAVLPDMIPGGEMHIYHTTDYFQTFTRYLHIIPEEGVINPEISILPTNVSLQVFPNPANAAFTISYQLDNMQSTNLKMYNILGQAVWAYQAGLQPPGNYQVPFTDNGLSSGKYFIQLEYPGSNIATPITIIR
jgi:hypothetical protein